MFPTKQNALRQEGASSNYRASDYHPSRPLAQGEPVNKLLSRLDKVRCTGRNKWIACCPAHDDRSPSLSICELDDGRVLLHCFAGCSMPDVVAAVGLQQDDLFPDRPINEHFKRGKRRPFVGADVLRAMAYEAMVIATSGAAIADGTLTDEDRQRCLLAVSRFNAGLESAGVQP